MTDDNLETTSAIHGVVATTTELVEGFDQLLTNNPRDYYTVPREVLVALRTVLSTNIHLVKLLFEENQEVADRIAKIRLKISKKE